MAGTSKNMRLKAANEWEAQKWKKHLKDTMSTVYNEALAKAVIANPDEKPWKVLSALVTANTFSPVDGLHSLERIHRSSSIR
jgi:hypothetical protein